MAAEEGALRVEIEMAGRALGGLAVAGEQAGEVVGQGTGRDRDLDLAEEGDAGVAVEAADLAQAPGLFVLEGEDGCCQLVVGSMTASAFPSAGLDEGSSNSTEQQ